MRDEHGRFDRGNQSGKQHRWPNGVSGNPAGRPVGVNGWTRRLGSKRYGRAELEDVLTDEHEHENKREAAMRLILKEIEKDAPMAWFPDDVALYKLGLAETPTSDLRWLVADPRENHDCRVAAYELLVEREALIPRTREVLWQDKRDAMERFRREVQRRTMLGDYR